MDLGEQRNLRAVQPGLDLTTTEQSGAGYSLPWLASQIGLIGQPDMAYGPYFAHP